MNVDIRSRIIQVATRMFGVRGYGSTSMREVVEACGVTKPTLYYHFGSKEGLFVATANAHLVALDQLTKDALASGSTLRERLEALLIANVEFAAAQPDVVRFLMTSVHQVEHGQPQIDLMSVDATLIRHLAEGFVEAKRTGEIAVSIDVPLAVISFLGVVRAWSLGAFHGAPIPKGFHITVVQQYLHGISS
jgi:AcrR family transcriptional regulator